MGTTWAQGLTPLQLIHEELGIKPGGNKVLKKCAGVQRDGRKATWLVIETTDGATVGVVAYTSTDRDGASCKVVDWSMGPVDMPPVEIVLMFRKVPSMGQWDQEWRDKVVRYYDATISLQFTRSGQSYTIDGYRGVFVASSVHYKGAPLFRTEEGSLTRFPNWKKLRARPVVS